MLNNHRPALRRFLAALILPSAFATGTPAHAQASIPGYPENVQGYDAREVAMLPKYCLVTTGFRTAAVPGSDDLPAFKHWESVFGVEMFKAMHHYCWGVMKTNRAILLARNKATREWYLNSAISEFDYVLTNVGKHAGSDFILLPEVLNKKGENLLRLGKVASAIRELEQAISIKPDYWPPYVALGDHYREAGDLKKAREVLERGLTHSPESKSLKTRLAELDPARNKRAPARPPGGEPAESKPPAEK